MDMRLWIKRGLLAVVVLIVVVLAVRYARPVFDFVSNEQQLQAWLDRLGPLGPLAVIALNALQVVVAFIPGYAMMITAGYLYGFPMGAVYGAHRHGPGRLDRHPVGATLWPAAGGAHDRRRAGWSTGKRSPTSIPCPCGSS